MIRRAGVTALSAAQRAPLTGDNFVNSARQAKELDIGRSTLNLVPVTWSRFHTECP